MSQKCTAPDQETDSARIVKVALIRGTLFPGSSIANISSITLPSLNVESQAKQYRKSSDEQVLNLEDLGLQQTSLVRRELVQAHRLSYKIVSLA